MAPGPADPTDADADRRLATVRALLAKAEATEFPDEAEAFFAKASELIGRYAIDEALLWAGAHDPDDRPAQVRLVVHAPYLGQKAVLVDAVARAHDCRAVRLMGPAGRTSEEISVVGFPSELRWVEALVTSLLLQLARAVAAQAPTGMTPAASAGWRRSFIVGFAEEVGERLRTDRAAAAQGAGPTVADGAPSSEPSGVAVVLASRAQEVDREFRRQHPRVRSAWTSSGRSRAGRDAGRTAGREASIGRHHLGGQRALGRGGG